MKRDMSVVGIDIAKRVFHLVGLDERGKIVLRRRCSRGEVLPRMANLGPTTIGMGACGGAHYWARCLREQGHEVKLMAPQFVKPYVKSNKTGLWRFFAVLRWFTQKTLQDGKIITRLWLPPPGRPSRGGARWVRVHNGVDAPHQPENAIVPWRGGGSNATAETPKRGRQRQTISLSLRTTGPESPPSPNAVSHRSCRPQRASAFDRC